MNMQQLITIIAGFLLLIFLIWKEVARAGKTRLHLRVASTVVAVISFVCIALPISYRKAINTIEGEVFIATDGYNKDSLKNLQKKGIRLPVYSFNEYLHAGDTNTAVLNILGYGLSEEELKQLHPNTNIHFYPSSLPEGIISITWQPQLQQGNQLIVQGQYNHAGTELARLLLCGYNTVLDSLRVQPGVTVSAFGLQAVPKHIGRNVFELVTVVGKDTVNRDPVPVVVNQPDRVHVLLLASSPGFELSFLQRWLAQNGYPIASRTRISQGKYDKAFFNTPVVNMVQINERLLDSIDLLVCDASELYLLNDREQQTIRTQLSDKGMGLLIQADTSILALYNGHLVRSFTAPGKVTQLSLAYPDGIHKKAILPVEDPLYVRQQPGTQPLITDSAGNTLATSMLIGNGMVAGNFLTNTYQWQLSGRNNIYADVWSFLLNKLTKPKIQKRVISTPAGFPVAGSPVTITSLADRAPDPLAIAGSRIFFRQDHLLPYRASGTWWPVTAGWQQRTASDEVGDWYVYDTSDWKLARAWQRIQATSQYATANNSVVDTIRKTGTEQVPVKKVWFFLLFLLSAGFLWAERKFNLQ